MRSQSVPMELAWPLNAASLGQHVGEWFPTSDQVLLGSFGVDLDGERTSRQLRDGLLAAGFASAAARHLIRVSPLLRRSSRGSYRIRPFEL